MAPTFILPKDLSKSLLLLEYLKHECSETDRAHYIEEAESTTVTLKIRVVENHIRSHLF